MGRMNYRLLNNSKLTVCFLNKKKAFEWKFEIIIIVSLARTNLNNTECLQYLTGEWSYPNQRSENWCRMPKKPKRLAEKCII
jgi:hypothetical protein